MGNGALHKKTIVLPFPDGSAARGQSGLLNDVYRLYRMELCRYVNKTFGSGPPEPEDVVQNAFAKFAALENLDSVESPRAFLYRTVHNIAISEKRRMQTHSKFVGDGIHNIFKDQGYYLTAERVLMATEQFDIVCLALAEMPRKRRRLLLLNRVHGLSLAEIGRRLHMSPQNAGKHIKHAVADLEAALKAANKGDTPGTGTE